MAWVTLGYLQGYPYPYPSKTHTCATGTGFQQVRVKGFIEEEVEVVNSSEEGDMVVKVVGSG